MKNIICLLLLGLPFYTLAQQKKVTISGKIGSYNEPAMIFLFKYTGPYISTVIDSMPLRNGEFHFESKVDKLAVHAAISVQERRPGSNPKRWNMEDDQFEFYLEPGHIRIHSIDSAKHATVEGSPTSNDYLHFKKRMDSLRVFTDARRQDLHDQWRNTPPAVRATPEYTDEYLAQFKAIRKEEDQLLINFMKEHPRSAINLDLVQLYAMSDYSSEKVESLFESFSPSLKRSATGKQIAGKIRKMKTLRIGKTAPVFTLSDTSGNPVSLSSFRGKYVLIEFWASWCGGCRAQNPHLVRAYEKFQGKDFDILSVSLDTKKYEKNWKQAIVQDKLSWQQVADLTATDWRKGKVVQQYQIAFIPQNYLLDPQGKIIARNLKGTELERILSERP